MGVPGLLGKLELQFLGQRFGHRHRLFTERSQSARSATELQAQQPWLQLAQALAMAGDRAQPAGDLHAEGDRRRLLQPGPPGQRRGRMALGLSRQHLAQTLQVSIDQLPGAAQLQHQAGVHDVLAGCAKMYITFSAGIADGDLLAQRLDQRDRRIAGGGDRFTERGKIVEPGLTGGRNRRDSRLRNQPDPRLRTGQRSFEVEHRLDPARVREDLGHIAGNKIGIEQLVARSLHGKSLVKARPLRARRSISDRGAGTPPASADAG